MANQAKRGQGGAVKRSGFAAKRRRAAWRMASMLCAVAALAAAVTAAVALSLRGGRLPAASMPAPSDTAAGKEQWNAPQAGSRRKKTVKCKGTVNNLKISCVLFARPLY